MKFTLESAHGIQIHGYRPGEVTLRLPAEDAAHPLRLVTYTSSLILSNTESVTDWSVAHISELALHHFEPAWRNKPEIVLLGSGRQLVFPDNEIRYRFAIEGIGFETMDTAAACRTYNVLLSEGRDVMALLIID